jgi:hypothetical protein
MIDKNMKPSAPTDEEDVTDQPDQSAGAPDEQADEPSNVTPQEQEQYDTIVVAALSFLYADGATKMVVQKLKDEASGNGGLAQAIGHTCAMILRSIKRALAQQNKQVPPDIMFHAGAEVIAEIITIAEHAGLAKEGDEALLRDAAFRAVKTYGDIELQTGELGPQQRQGAQQEMAQLKGMVPQKKQGLVDQNMAPQGAEEENA